jgi:hypothetical protein
VKNKLTVRALGAVILSSAFLLASTAQSRADLTYYVILNVASLVGNSNGPFSLDLQLAPGSNLVTNTVSLSNFSVSGGTFSGSPDYTAGGFSGSLGSTLTLTNSSNVNNEFAEAFTAGATQISFSVDQTQNSEIGVNPINEQFNVFVDDSTVLPINTTDPSGNATLVESQSSFGASLSGISTFSSTSPDAGVVATVSTVPEPASAGLLLLGAGGLLARRRSFRRA